MRGAGRGRRLSCHRSADYCGREPARSDEKNFGGYRGLNNSHCRARAAPAEPATREPGRLPYNSSEILFPALDVYHDDDAHSATMNMAIDEALLEGLRVPAVRFYRWESPSLSFGYF